MLRILAATFIAFAGAEAPVGLIVSVPELLNRAQQAYNDRADHEKGRQAIKLWQSVLDVDPDNYEALWKLARAHYWLGNRSLEKSRLEIFSNGKNYAETAVESNPAGIDGHYWLGVCLGRYGEVKGIFKSLFLIKPIRKEMEAVLKLDPDHAGAYHVLGIVYRKASAKPLNVGSMKKSLQFAKMAVELDPASIRYATGLAEAYRDAGKIAEAIKVLEDVLQMPPAPEYLPESPEDKEIANKLLLELKNK